MSTYHLAQINIARMLAPIDDPVMAAFATQLAPVNALEHGKAAGRARSYTSRND